MKRLYGRGDVSEAGLDDKDNQCRLAVCLASQLVFQSLILKKWGAIIFVMSLSVLEHLSGSWVEEVAFCDIPPKVPMSFAPSRYVYTPFAPRDFNGLADLQAKCMHPYEISVVEPVAWESSHYAKMLVLQATFL